MFTRYTHVLGDKKGFANVFVFAAMAVIVMFAAGVALINYSSQSMLATQNQNLTAAIAARANEYVGAMNQTLSPNSEEAPSVLSEMDPRTALTTTITRAYADRMTIALTIVARNASGSSTMTRSATLFQTQVTHITDFDEAGNPVWALASEPDAYVIWGLAAGSIRALTDAETAGLPSSEAVMSQATGRLGLDAAGSLWAWGDNTAGQAGNGTTDVLATPVRITPAAKYRFVASDASESFAIDSAGRLWAWGAGGNGILGTGDLAASATLTPTAVASALTFQSVSTSAGSTFAIDSHGDLWAWGTNDGSRLGIPGVAASIISTPTRVLPTSTFYSVNTSGGTTFAIDTAGKLWGWGVNTDGRLGDGTATDRAIPTAIAAAKTFSAVSTSGSSTQAIDRSGQPFAWGLNHNGQLGDGTMTSRRTPVAVSTTAKFTAVLAGAATSYGLDTTGHLYAWGDNSTGQYGAGVTAESIVPRAVLASVQFRSLATDVSAGPLVAAVDTFGGLWAIGQGTNSLWPLGFTFDSLSALKMPSAILKG